MPATAKHTCCERMSDGASFYDCGKTAKVEVEGEWYCGIHSPFRQQASDAKLEKQQRESLAIATFPKLVEQFERIKLACAYAIEEDASMTKEQMAECIVTIADAALALARGEQP